MSHRSEFLATVVDGRIELPREIAAQLRLRGTDRLRVVISSVAEEEARLGARGITEEMVDTIASMQRIDRDVVITILGGEGSAAGSPLGDRLMRLSGEKS